MTRLDILVLFLILKEKLSVCHHFILFSCGLSQVAFIMFRYISSVPMLRGFFFFFMNRCWILSKCFYVAFIEMIREGNGNPLQYSCLENPRNRGAWWTAIYGVTQSQTWLKQLGSSSSSIEMIKWFLSFILSMCILP